MAQLWHHVAGTVWHDCEGQPGFAPASSDDAMGGRNAQARFE